MNYSNLFERAATLVWRHKFMWLLGILVGINSTLFGIVRLAVRMALPPLPSWLIAGDVAVIWEKLASIEEVFNWLTPQRLFGYGAGLTTAVFIWAILFWLIVTIAEGGMIAAVRDAEAEKAVTFGASLRAGWGWLGRFAAVDALVFLPWFLLSLLLMIGGGAFGLFTIYQASTPGTSLDQIMLRAGGGLLCMMPLLMLLMLFSRLTIWYRVLAFRDAALLDHDVKTAVRHPFRLIKANISEIVGVTALLWGISTAVGWGISIVSFFSFLSFTAGSPFTYLLDFAAILLIALLKGALAAFVAAAWTLAYQEWIIKN